MDFIYKLLIIWFAYSIVTTVLVIVLDNDDVTGLLAMGPFGWILFILLAIAREIQKFFKYKFKKMSIWEDTDDNWYRCNPDMYQDIRHCEQSKGYKLIKRYATKREWKDLPTFPEEFLEACLLNCNRCIHKKECDEKYEHGEPIRCKTDKYGTITEYSDYKLDTKKKRNRY